MVLVIEVTSKSTGESSNQSADADPPYLLKGLAGGVTYSLRMRFVFERGLNDTLEGNWSSPLEFTTPPGGDFI